MPLYLVFNYIIIINEEWMISIRLPIMINFGAYWIRYIINLSTLQSECRSKSVHMKFSTSSVYKQYIFGTDCIRYRFHSAQIKLRKALIRLRLYSINHQFIKGFIEFVKNQFLLKNIIFNSLSNVDWLSAHRAWPVLLEVVP